MTAPKVFIGVPTYDLKCDIRIIGALKDCGIQGAPFAFCRSGVLPFCFNSLLCNALNHKKTHGITHFLLWHSDVIPTKKDWLLKMLRIQNETKADILSAVIPLKDQRGLTSTAIDCYNNNWHVRRLTMTEIFQREPTFTDPQLLVNSGLMLVDLSYEWVTKIAFQFDEMIRQVDGKFEALSMSEDWVWSRHARDLGAEIWATREIDLVHSGHMDFPNNAPWGSLKEDLGDLKPGT